MRLWIWRIALVAIVTLVALVARAQAASIMPDTAEPGCMADPLAIYGPGAEARYRIIDPCYTLSGVIAMFAQETLEQGGEIHLALWDPTLKNPDGVLDVEFADVSLLPEYDALGHIPFGYPVTVTGALVFDNTRQRVAMHPAFRLHSFLREYPERRADGSVWLVQQWTFGWSEREVTR